MTQARVFFCEETGIYRRYLRRYASGACGAGPYSFCNAMVSIGDVECAKAPVSGDLWPHDDARWPATCEHCGRTFARADTFQLFHVSLYRRIDSGEFAPWDEMPVGAVRDSPWLRDEEWHWKGPDGRVLVCKTPGGDWTIDARASNCTMPDDNAHRCWVRHGRLEDGTLHVDKNGLTCAAGAGSIDMNGRWHGFLHNGVLSENG